MTGGRRSCGRGEQPMQPIETIRAASSIEQLMPDEDRRDVALGGMAKVIENAGELYPNHVAPGTRDKRLRGCDGRPRWADVLEELSLGGSHEDAARRLGIGIETVRTHLQRAKRALGARNTPNAVAEALRRGLIK